MKIENDTVVIKTSSTHYNPVYFCLAAWYYNIDPVRVEKSLQFVLDRDQVTDRDLLKEARRKFSTFKLAVLGDENLTTFHEPWKEVLPPDSIDILHLYLALTDMEIVAE